MPRVEQRVELLAHSPLPETIIATAAKLCYSASDIGDLRDKVSKNDQSKFIQKLADMGHFSTFEHVCFTFAIEGVSRALLAQITRHRIASFSVQSQRYVNQTKNKDSINYVIPQSIKELGDDAVKKFDEQMQQMTLWYNEWVDELADKGKQANEDARFVLPNACETRMIMTMNVRELLHFFELRCCERAQWEIREIAWQMLSICIEKAPQLFSMAGPACIAGACSQGDMSCKKMKEVRERQAKLREES